VTEAVPKPVGTFAGRFSATFASRNDRSIETAAARPRIGTKIAELWLGSRGSVHFAEGASYERANLSDVRD